MPATAPVPNALQDSRPIPQYGQEARRRKLRILIVDDEPDQVTVLLHRLESLGYQLNAVGTGQQALERARTQHFDLILLDVGLPDASGYEICQRLGDDPSTWTIPVVMVSGTDDPDAVRRSRVAGSRYFLRKPYDPNVLLIVLQSALGQTID